MEAKKRLYLDTVKGIAIFLMLWTHCIQYCAKNVFSAFDNTVFRVVYVFHMPLLMMVSGYLFFFSFRKRDLKTLLIHRTQAMLQPIVFCTVLNNVLMNLAYHFLSGNDTWTGGVLLNGFKNLYWFLWCVLASSVAVGIACKITNHDWLRRFLLVVGAGFLLLFPEPDFQLFMYPFFVTGFWWAGKKESATRFVKHMKYAAFLLFPLVLAFYKKEYYIYHTPIFSEQYGVWGSLWINLIRFSAGLLGSVCILVLAEKLVKWASGKDTIPWIVKGFGKLGESSLQIYCLSVPLLSGYLPIVYDKVIQIFGGNIFAQNVVLFNFLFTPLLAALYAAGLYLLILALKKVRVHSLLFGR